MAYQMTRPVKVPAKGDAPDMGINKTPAPVSSADLALKRDRSLGRTSYGANAYGGASSIAPGAKTSSPLADQLKAKAAESDGGDLLQRIIERGTARGTAADVELQSPQTRDVSKEPYPAAHGQRSRTADHGSGSPSGQVPTHCGAPVMDDSAARRAAQLKNTQ
jgi:hypothetical protein